MQAGTPTFTDGCGIYLDPWGAAEWQHGSAAKWKLNKHAIIIHMLTKPSSLLHSFHIQRSSFSVDNFRLSAKIFFIGTWWNHALSPLYMVQVTQKNIFFIFLFLYAKVFYNPYEPKLRLDECTSCTAIGKAQDVAPLWLKMWERWERESRRRKQQDLGRCGSAGLASRPPSSPTLIFATGQCPL